MKITSRLLVIEDELNKFSYVRSWNAYSAYASQVYHWTRDSKFQKSVAILFGWKYLHSNGRCYPQTYEVYYLRNGDYPLSKEYYDGGMHRPAEAITPKEMLVRLGGV
jgi:hypothetical protein